MAILKNVTFNATDTVSIPSGTSAQRPTAIYSTPGTYTWTCPSGVTTVDILVVAGGGGGGGNLSGGGGAGGVVFQTSATVSPGTGYSVVVGSGGRNITNGTQAGIQGVSGGNSSFSGAGFSTITAFGGGGAGAGANNVAAASGGSGGGGGGYGSVGGNAGGAATAGSGGTARYGNAGGAGGGGNNYPGGGGGGAGGVGVSPPSSSSPGGNGGPGINIPAFGAYFWGGGGGGACYVNGNSGNGGSGGGGGGASGGGGPDTDVSTNPWTNGSGAATLVGTGSFGATRGISLGMDGGFNQPFLSVTKTDYWYSGGQGGECTGGGGGGSTHQGRIGGHGGNGYVLIRWCDRGFMRYNTDFQVTEYFDGAIWKNIDKSMVAWSTGAEIKQVGSDVVHIWQSAGTHYFYPQHTGDVRLLVVGGGGSGGTSSTNCSGGAGGGGGVADRTHSVIAGNTYTITVGPGALGGTVGSDSGGDNSFHGRTGTHSVFSNSNSTSIVVGYGGGGGGGGQSRNDGYPGGSGGGGAWGNYAAPGGQGRQYGAPFNASFGNANLMYAGGNDGGTANSGAPSWGGGGGGGAAERGVDGFATSAVGSSTGGGGRATGITGETRFFGAGGGGACCGSTQVAGLGGQGGGGNSYNFRAAAHGTHATGSGGGAGSYNGGGYQTGDGGCGIVVIRYLSRTATIGNSQTNPARSAAQIKSYNPTAQSGLYWITDGTATQQVYCDMDYDGGGWMLVSSNDARDTTIPSGTSRQNQQYELDRPSITQTANGNALVGTVGIDPNGDYIIGGIINNLPFSEVRVWGWGRGSTNNTYRWPDNLGYNVKAQWGLTSTGSSRLSEVRNRQYVFFSGSAVPRVTTANGFLGTLAVSTNAAWYVLDSNKVDRLNGGYSSNTNQCTIGGAGVTGSSGDPTTGCYLGHGASEGSFEGWYDAYESAADAQGYSTWVR